MVSHSMLLYLIMNVEDSFKCRAACSAKCYGLPAMLAHRLGITIHHDGSCASPTLGFENVQEKLGEPNRC